MLHPVADLLASDGPVARCVDGFQVRPQQQRMAELVEQAIRHSDRLVVEAGTGVGKTFAYLIPALRSGLKVIVSTGTKHLQDQLYYRDLSVILKALGIKANTALLKGRANYLCWYRLEHTLAQEHDAHPGRALQRIADWARITRTGDIAELSGIPEDSPLWAKVTATADNCLGVDCPKYQHCFVVKVRRAAQAANLIVINHHLFFADLALKEEGFGEVLPSANAVIMDEAHQLAETATAFFGITLSSRQIRELVRDTIAEQVSQAPDMVALARQAEKLDKAVRDLRLALGPAQQRANWTGVRNKSKVSTLMQALGCGLDELQKLLKAAGGRSKGLQNCKQRTTKLIATLKVMVDTPHDSVQWVETYRRSFVLHQTPLEIAEIFSHHAQSYPRAWIFTSATLSVDGNFEHFTRQLGLGKVQCEHVDSPFDYARNAMLYLPEGIPNPVDPFYTRYVIQWAQPVIEAAGGRTFMLFTSHRALGEAAELLAGSLNFPLLVQGQAPRGKLLERFRQAGDAVLLGTNSFWEGVDVKGPALRCVIIDKLPFASPNDPVLKARLDVLRAQGRNPFIEYQIPHAVITLKQGVGRLIRDETDTGILMICDPRLMTYGYGKVFLASLPEMSVTQDITEVCSFLNLCEQRDECARH
jgi:ATP-dependent DNA helicase DinG